MTPAGIERRRTPSPSHCSGIRLEVGDCGPYRYIELYDTSGGIDDFGPDGRLVAGEWGGDIDQTCRGRSAGEVPECTRVPTKVMCPHE